MPFAPSSRPRSTSSSPVAGATHAGWRAAAASTVVAGLLFTGGVAPAQAASTYSSPLRTAVESLPVAAENNADYNRDKQFGDWNDTNRDCQNTRAEVLQNESKAKTSFTTTKRCTVKGGKWVTTWDGKVHTSTTPCRSTRPGAPG